MSKLRFLPFVMTLALAGCGGDIELNTPSAQASSTTSSSTTSVARATTRGTATAGQATTRGTVAPPSTTRAATPPSTRPFTYGSTDCPPSTGAAAQSRTFAAPFKRCIDPAKSYTATVKTNKGILKIRFDSAGAPGTVNNFVALALHKYFDGIRCHRVLVDFVAQGGDPTGTGSGGPGYKFADELPKAGQYKVGSVAMANSGPNTNGSQFFIITGAKGTALPPNYSLFGEVIEGLDVLKIINSLGAASDPSPPKETIALESVTISVV